MARLRRKRKRKEEKRCKRCNGKLEEGNWRWCDECQKAFRAEYKDADPDSNYELHVLPSIIKDENGF